jgi:hypothetical protein
MLKTGLLEEWVKDSADSVNSRPLVWSAFVRLWRAGRRAFRAMAQGESEWSGSMSRRARARPFETQKASSEGAAHTSFAGHVK